MDAFVPPCFCASCERATRVFLGIGARHAKSGSASLSTRERLLQRTLAAHYWKADSICENPVNRNRTHRSVNRCSAARCGALCGHPVRSALRRPTRCARRRTAAVVPRRPIGFGGGGRARQATVLGSDLFRGGTRCVTDEHAPVVLRLRGGGIALIVWDALQTCHQSALRRRRLPALIGIGGGPYGSALRSAATVPLPHEDCCDSIARRMQPYAHGCAASRRWPCCDATELACAKVQRRRARRDPGRRKACVSPERSRSSPDPRGESDAPLRERWLSKARRSPSITAAERSRRRPSRAKWRSAADGRASSRATSRDPRNATRS